MTYDVLMGTLNPTHWLTHRRIPTYTLLFGEIKNNNLYYSYTNANCFKFQWCYCKATAPRPRPQPPKPRPKPRMSENATAVIWLKRDTDYLAKHLEISSNSYIQRFTHMKMLVSCCHTSLLHFKYMSVSNKSDMRSQAFKAKAKTKAKA